jgi:hypothetical protein
VGRFSLNPVAGFLGAANQSVHKILDAMVPALSSAIGG